MTNLAYSNDFELKIIWLRFFILTETRRLFQSQLLAPVTQKCNEVIVSYREFYNLC